MTSRHTLGPCVVGKNNPSRVYLSNGQIVADCDSNHVGVPIFEHYATLFATAPELLEALENMIFEVRKSLSPGIKCRVTYLCEEYEALSAKARGAE